MKRCFTAFALLAASCTSGQAEIPQVDTAMGDVSSGDAALDSRCVPTAEFTSVADLVRQNCLLLGCHGGSGVVADVFAARAGVSATDAEVYAAMQGVTTGGEALIVACSPETSAILDATIADHEFVATLTALGDWITHGANFDNCEPTTCN